MSDQYEKTQLTVYTRYWYWYKLYAMGVTK